MGNDSQQKAHSAWVDAAVAKTEKAINALLDRFVDDPYLHRCEHSMHCELYTLLMDEFAPEATCDFGSFVVRPVQKEWPETSARPSKKGLRGNFDLVVLNQSDRDEARNLRQDFLDGKQPPCVVIEMGLDYGLGHLKADERKLLNSKASNGYLVHLLRKERFDPRHKHTYNYVGHLMSREANGGPKIAFAAVHGETVWLRKLGDAKIDERNDRIPIRARRS